MSVMYRMTCLYAEKSGIEVVDCSLALSLLSAEYVGRIAVRALMVGVIALMAVRASVIATVLFLFR